MGSDSQKTSAARMLSPAQVLPKGADSTPVYEGATDVALKTITTFIHARAQLRNTLGCVERPTAEQQNLCKLSRRDAELAQELRGVLKQL